jgi:hypothetical protein
MAEQELDLIELAAGQVAKARACTPYSALRRQGGSTKSWPLEFPFNPSAAIWKK